MCIVYFFQMSLIYLCPREVYCICYGFVIPHDMLPEETVDMFGDRIDWVILVEHMSMDAMLDAAYLSLSDEDDLHAVLATVEEVASRYHCVGAIISVLFM